MWMSLLGSRAQAASVASWGPHAKTRFWGYLLSIPPPQPVRMNVASCEALPYLPVGKVHEDTSGRCRGPAASQLKASPVVAVFNAS